MKFNGVLNIIIQWKAFGGGAHVQSPLFADRLCQTFTKRSLDGGSIETYVGKADTFLIYPSLSSFRKPSYIFLDVFAPSMHIWWSMIIYAFPREGSCHSYLIVGLQPQCLKFDVTLRLVWKLVVLQDIIHLPVQVKRSKEAWRAKMRVFKTIASSMMVVMLT